MLRSFSGEAPAPDAKFAPSGFCARGARAGTQQRGCIKHIKLKSKDCQNPFDSLSHTKILSNDENIIDELDVETITSEELNFDVLTPNDFGLLLSSTTKNTSLMVSLDSPFGAMMTSKVTIRSGPKSFSLLILKLHKLKTVISLFLKCFLTFTQSMPSNTLHLLFCSYRTNPFVEISKSHVG